MKETHSFSAEDFQDSLSFAITEEDVARFRRLDQFLAEKIPYLSRSSIKKLFLSGHIEKENAEVPFNKGDLKKMPVTGTQIVVYIPPPIPAEAEPENIPLEILYEDEHLLFVNKQAGLVVHPAPGNYTGTLVNAILYHCPDLKGIGHVKRPGIVHRLDKGTSGVMVVAKTQQTHEKLIELFSEHKINRLYEAIGINSREISIAGKIESTIGRSPHNRYKMAANVRNGKKAITHYKILNTKGNLIHFELKLETGRTHQIRVHLTQLLHAAIVCDPLYGNLKTQMQKLPKEVLSLLKDYSFPLLHAKTLGLEHPITGKYLEFTALPPHPLSAIIGFINEQE